mmetsp:Transcript_62258/g.74929  ORF Transcript_62258/g.74929 Transcript_62258/m.74929 type:complete len:341 (+) Transcript_62258:117-1139(+)|eukprot:CAMPEP_0194352760 /NCGR_PEP_ID=MMETSP0174-20130528/1198_1 /TAXON_ID=216777 /ORGANISM="Proboscia alata, Strain PI-D3" /LENGTH=340 /DNA_ID=CAMNT_0039121045 /DNA_START=117 /DNA_END=1139 /DNA_ORIENTATION=+
MDTTTPSLLLNNSTSTTLDGVESVTCVDVHPLVLLSVLDHHTRRPEGAGRVIGTLLGRRDGSRVEVTNSFAVPHAERGDEVAIGKDFNRQMLALHMRANPREVVVGWYATALPPPTEDGDAPPASGYKRIADTSSLIHEFYAGECSPGETEGDPIHLVLDTSLQFDSIGMKAYKSTPVVIAGEPYANLFHEIRVAIKSTESEKITVHKMIQSQIADMDAAAKNMDGEEKEEKVALVTAVNDSNEANNLTESMEQMLQMLNTVSGYIDEVVSENVPLPSDDTIGRRINDALSSVPRIRNEIFEGMFHDNLQDLLMISYLSNVTKTQLVIAEKLNQALTLGA